MTKKLLAGAVAAAVVGMAPMTASAVNFKDVMSGDVDFSIGGYVKLSAMWSDFSHGDADNGDNDLSTFYIPGRIPTSGTGEDNSDFQATARESRINFKASKKVGDHALTAFIEMDFMTTDNTGGQGNEIISNSYNPRLRHAFFKYDNWLVGQTWSTFMDVGVLPESVDFLGASEGTVFVRQPQVRYTSGAFQVALENSETFTSSFPADDRDDNELPDLTANYTFKFGGGHLRVNGLLRKITADESIADDSATGWGLGLTGKVMVGKDDLKFSIHHGEGMARYTGLALPRDASYDAVTGDLNLTETTAYFVAYRHWWTDNLRSSIIYSGMETDYDNGDMATTFNDMEESESWAINLMYSPVKPVTIGIMYLEADVDKVNGDSGDMERIQVSAKYAF